jgi:hypothetical protein
MILSLAILLFPTFVSADCANLERITHWILETSHTVLFYVAQKPIARVEMPNCEISPLSTIRLLNSYVCDSDKILIDGVACNIITVKVLD